MATTFKNADREKGIKANTAILDGEIVALDQAGVPCFAKRCDSGCV